MSKTRSMIMSEGIAAISNRDLFKERLMNMAVKITVVMPAYRENEIQIKQAIKSILSQTMKEFVYIIVLDDPQNIELKQIIENYARVDNRITLVVNEKNSGCPFSKDRGIRLAQTEYVAIMDSDDIAHPKRLERQLEKMDNEKLDLIASYVTVISNDGMPLYHMNHLPLTHDKIVKKMRVNNCMPHPTWMFRREMYLALDGYTDMQGCEDYDFLIRAIQAGYQLGMVGEILLKYRLSDHSVSRGNLYRQYLMMEYIQDKYYYHKMRYANYDEYERDKYNDRSAAKYTKASVEFEKAVIAKANNQYLQMFVSLARSVSMSGEYAKKIMRYVMQESSLWLQKN